MEYVRKILNGIYTNIEELLILGGSGTLVIGITLLPIDISYRFVLAGITLFAIAYIVDFD